VPAVSPNRSGPANLATIRAAVIEAQATVLRWYEPLVVPACPKTTIQVIRSGGAHAGLLAHFVIADLDGKPPVVYLETAAEGQITDSSSVVAHVALSFDRIRAGPRCQRAYLVRHPAVRS
jgi:hypothetical protein